MKKIKHNLWTVKLTKMNKGFTLVELLIAISIMAVMAVILIGTLNPIALANKAKDSRRKNDLKKIKIAFEAYYNNNGSYPTDISWNVASNCRKSVPQMSFYFQNLPCDPDNFPYTIRIINSNTFMILTNLQNKKDKDIPPNWYTGGVYGYSGSRSSVNYGVSSSNILWYE